MSAFEIYLRENKNEDTTSLIDFSYNNYRMYGIKKNNPNYKEVNMSLVTNDNLATYGDFVVKLAFCELLCDNEKLTKEKSKYESDEAIVKYIAKHYKLLDYIKYDHNDLNKPM